MGYQPLYDFLVREYDAHLIEQQMDEIINIVMQMKRSEMISKFNLLKEKCIDVASDNSDAWPCNLQQAIMDINVEDLL